MNALNGAPYQIKDVINPIRDIELLRTYELRRESEAIDAIVEDYLTEKLPEPDRPGINVIPSRHILFSPFFSRLIDDLKNKRYNPEELASIRDNSTAELFCEPYLPLLEHDPLNPDLAIPERYILIHPTIEIQPIGISLDAYNFMKRVVELYGRDRIILSSHLTIDLGAG